MPTFANISAKPHIIYWMIIFSFCSCNTHNDITVIKALDESLTKSNNIISSMNGEIFYALEKKLSDPVTHEKALVWYPKALLIHQTCDTMIAYIENLKNNIKGESSETMRDLFESKKAGNKLYERLKRCKEDLLNIDARLSNEFSNSIQVTTASFDSLPEKEKKFKETFFKSVPIYEAIAILNKFENNIKIAENKMLTYSNFSSDVIVDDFESYSAIIAQSSSYVVKGEKIEITAGIGSFSRAAKPEIKINNRKMELNDMGFVRYNLKASDELGKHYVPVEITFIDQDGKKQTITKNVKYTVAEENQKQ